MKNQRRYGVLSLLLMTAVFIAGCADDGSSGTLRTQSAETASREQEEITEPETESDPEDWEYVGMRDVTTMELVRDMGIGINLGNTFESCGDWIAQWGDGSVQSYETAWEVL